MAVNMDTRLIPGCLSGFSKTAGSRVGHDEARRHRNRPAVAAVRGGRRADDVAKGPAERAQTRKADVQADLGDAPAGRPEQEHRPLDPSALQVAVRGLTERRAERA